MIFSSLINRVAQKWFNTKQKTAQGVQSARDTVFRGGIVVVSVLLIIWTSIFLYTAFYYAYMPSMAYVRPVHLQFKSCEKEKGVCSFPSAHVQLTKKQQLLMVGQPYKVNLHLEMPESPANKELGMFMVCAQLWSRDGTLVQDSCRPAMLHYRSALLHTLTTLTFSPMMVLGSTEEKQTIVLELFGNFEEDQSHPVTVIHVEIQSRYVEFYSATIMINAHLSGLRYLMFHWPILSAIVGIGTNLFFITLICALSYLHFTSEEENNEELLFGYEKEKPEEEKDLKSNSDNSSESSSLDDISMPEELSPRVQVEPWSPSSSEPWGMKSSYIQEVASELAEPARGETTK